MKRISLLPLAAVATTAASVCCAPVAHAGTGSHAGLVLESRVSHQIAHVDLALSRIEKAPSTRRLDADVRAQVTASIDADQSTLADLDVALDTADTRQEVRSIAAQVSQYRPSIYTHVVADLHRADRVDDKVDDTRGLLNIHLDVDLASLLHSVEASLDDSVDAALSLDATSTPKEVHSVSVDLTAAAHAYAHATD